MTDIIVNTTDSERLHWERVGGAHRGIVAEYGSWRFRCYAWQRGDYYAIAHNTDTQETKENGTHTGQLKTQKAGRAWLENIWREARDADRRRGIWRG